MNSENESPPPPPQGYEFSQDIPETSPLRVRVEILLGVFVAVAVVVFIAWMRRSQVMFDSPILTLGVLPLIVIEVIAHEGLHALVGRWAGCQTLFRIEWDGINSAPAVLSYGAFQTRKETILFYLVPLGVTTLVGLPVLLFASGVLPAAALAVLSVAFLGSIGDLQDVWFVFQLPDATLEYHTRAGEVQHYTPI
jgi:hypothetical protein